jgi:hypothetical protein
MPVSFRTSIFLGASSVVCFRFVLLFVMFPSLQYLCVWLVLPNPGRWWRPSEVAGQGGAIIFQVLGRPIIYAGNQT